MEDLCEFKNGIAFKSSWFCEKGTYQVLKLGNVKNGRVQLGSPLSYLDDEYLQPYIESAPLAGEILISMTGTRFKRDYGFVGRIPENAKVLVNQRVGRLIVDKQFDGDFLFHYLKSRHFRDQFFSGETGGVNQGNVGSRHIQECKVPVPPLAEQKRIVEKLDEVLAQVDIIKARLDGIPALLKRFRQSVLASAVSGKLTEEWRGERVVGDWKSLAIGDVSTVATGKTPKRTNSDYWNSSDVPWLTSSATGSLFCFEAEQYVSNFGVEDCKLKQFPVGTLLLAMYGEGKTRGQVTELMIKATCNQACAAIIVDENKALKSYVKLRLLENYEETRKAAAGGNQPNLNLNKVREIGIQLPSLEEQKEIVRLVDQYFAFAETIEAQVKKAQARVDNLTQSILAKAFRGELVPQDPNDEPADKLLERITEARKEAEALAKAAKKAQSTKSTAKKKVAKSA
ncbi:TPA: type I restriction endonuclease subunit S [Vibrio vulnificus]|nr:type I restriction endonuclease subunit S [Vibrio vulnificus]EGQ7991301.1 type I restriction endonuclease subunit S [Vibrio vulnificus]RZP76674.1 type I restriction endonuclease subunit S [Vibrio vulnificus]RZQ74540.1 type I restriction endonuclease subunit S [Vibrio vulnificus]RZR22057.1 type I restriction endonuclease subunit S [Vibrio vulnificus]